MMSKRQQRQVWQRVYPIGSQHRRISREALRQSQLRLRQNLRFYESQQTHPVYAQAFQHMARQAEEQMKMLQQIMEG